MVAREQTAGRGRRGRSFLSERDRGVYLSVLLRPEAEASDCAGITAFAAVAVCDAVENVCGVRADIKWVNDLLINGKKICGILTELCADADGAAGIVVGVGINVKGRDFPPELRDVATSISNECGRPIERSRFCAELINEMNALYPQLESGAFMAENRARSNVIGREIYVLRGDERYPATAVDIDDGGSLVIRTPEGETRTLRSGEISVRFR